MPLFHLSLQTALTFESSTNRLRSIGEEYSISLRKGLRLEIHARKGQDHDRERSNEQIWQYDS